MLDSVTNKNDEWNEGKNVYKIEKQKNHESVIFQSNNFTIIGLMLGQKY